MKKKGNALVYVIFIVTILGFLGGMLLFTALSAYKITSINQKRDKLYLISESGIEKGIALLKQKIANTYEVFADNTIPLACQKFSFSEKDFDCEVSYEDIDNYDGGGSAVAITSKAVNKVNSITKTIKIYTLKKDITNKYYDFAFNNILTAIGDRNNASETSFFMSSNVNNLNIKGNVYLQGNKITLNPGMGFNYGNGGVTINSNLLNTVVNNPLNNAMMINTNCQIDPVTLVGSVQRGNSDGADSLQIKYNNSYDNELKDFYEDTNYKNLNPQYKVLSAQMQTKSKDGFKEPTLVGFKVTKNNETQTTTFNWAALVKDVKNYIMRNMIVYRTKTQWQDWVDNKNVNNNPSLNKLQDDYSESIESGYYCYRFKGAYNIVNFEYNFEKLYEGMYKVYLIDGDAIIKKENNMMYINHVIYMTGKATLKGGASSEFEFRNGSITAKKIEFTAMTAVTLEAPKMLNSNVQYQYSPFSLSNRASINKFFIEHIDRYADAIIFKIKKQEEK